MANYMSTPVHLAWALALIAAVGCVRPSQESNSPSPEADQLRTFLEVAPEERLAAANRRGELQLLGVQGFALTIPGIDEPEASRYRDRYGVLPIPGTTDTPESPEHERLNRQAEDYATRYNRLLLKMFREDPSR